MPSWRLRKARSPSRTTAWSSAISTRIMRAPPARPSFRRRARSGSRAGRRAPWRVPPSRSDRDALSAARPARAQSRCRRRRPRSHQMAHRPRPRLTTIWVCAARDAARCGAPRARSAAPPGRGRWCPRSVPSLRSSISTPWMRSSISISLRSAPGARPARAPEASARGSASAARQVLRARARRRRPSWARGRVCGPGRAGSRPPPRSEPG